MTPRIGDRVTIEGTVISFLSGGKEARVRLDTNMAFSPTVVSATPESLTVIEDVPDPTETATTPTCPRCLHRWHGRRVCRDANCCSCRLTWREVLRGRRRMTTCDCNPTLIRRSASPWTCPHGNTWRLGVEGDPYCWTPVTTSASLQRRCFDECEIAGWDPDKLNSFAEECAHLHEEVSEAFREWRRHKNFEIRYDADGKPTGIPIELADVLIGLFYNAELYGFDLLEAFEIKHRWNLARRYSAEGRQLHPQVHDV